MTHLGPGLVKTPTGFRAFVRIPIGRGRTKLASKRFGANATVTAMKQWREDQRVQARERLSEPDGVVARPNSFAADVATYLRQIEAMPTYEWRKRDLYVWREVFGDTTRADITAAMIREQLQAWRHRGPVLVYVPRTKTYKTKAKPLSASACNHRRTALLHLYTILDGKGAPNPVREVLKFKEPAPEPRARQLAFLQAAITRLRNPDHQAIAGVLLWTGMRGNSELSRMKRDHVDLERAVCFIPTGKGGRRFRTVPLNRHGLAAWAVLIDRKLLGQPYDKNLFRKAFQRACRAEAKARGLGPAHVRPYDQRHSVATAYLQAGADLADVQELLGHTSPRMTRRYAPFQLAKLAGVAAKLA